MFYSLFLYFSVLTSVSILNYLNYKYYYKGIFIFMSFYILLLLASIRYNIGTDYSNYSAIFNEIKYGIEVHTEIGYYYLNKGVIFLNLPFETVIFISSLLILIFIYKSVSRKYLMLFIFLYISSNSYFQSLSLIRQALAISIALYAVSNIYKSGFLKYLLWILFASSFHLSAILYLPIYFLRKLPITYIYAFLLIIWFYIVMNTDIINFIINTILPMTPYGIYVGGKYFTKEIMLGSGLGVAFRLIIGFIILLYSSKIRKKFPEANILLLLLFIYEVSYILSLKIYIFNRLADTFSLFFIFIIPYFVYSFNRKILQKSITIFFIFIFLILMYKNLSNDYYQVSGGVGVMPYKSLLY